MKRIQTIIGCALALMLAGTANLRAAEEGRMEGKATVRAVHGDVQYQENGTWMQLRDNQELSAGVMIRTGGDGVADLQVNGRSALRIGENSMLQIPTMSYMGSRGQGDTETMLDLQSGAILGNVKKLSASSHYEIKTPHGVAGIRGTDFQVTATPEGNGQFRVTFTSVQGIVIVSAIVGGDTVVKTLRTGESWTPGEGDVHATPVQLLISYQGQLFALNGVVFVVVGGQLPPIPILHPFPTGGQPGGQPASPPGEIHTIHVIPTTPPPDE